MTANYIVEPLGAMHDRAVFTCGVEPLDRYLYQQAGQDIARHAAAVYILRSNDASAIAGYYTLSASSIEPRALPAEVTKRLPRYPTLPAILIGRLAVDQHYRGQSLGKRLLMSVLHRSLQISRDLGAVAVIVDAKDDAACQFYEHYHFRQFIDQPQHLFLPMKTIAQLFP